MDEKFRGPEETHRFRWFLVVGACLALALPLIAIIPTPAFAATFCGDGSQGAADIVMNVMTYAPKTSNENLTHFGTKASTGIWIPDTTQNPTCGRASSLFVQQVGSSPTTLSNAEVGWFEIGTSVGPECGGSAGGSVWRLEAWTLSGTWSCRNDGHTFLTDGHYEPMNVHETVASSSCSPTNNSWEWDDSGTPIFTRSLDFCTGLSDTNGEAHSLDDNAHAVFDGLQWYGASGGWKNWLQNITCADDNPWTGTDGYDPSGDTATYTDVVHANPDSVSASACWVQ